MKKLFYLLSLVIFPIASSHSMENPDVVNTDAKTIYLFTPETSATNIDIYFVILSHFTMKDINLFKYSAREVILLGLLTTKEIILFKLY